MINSSLFSLNIKGTLITLKKPLVMGILNLTPDSFFDGGKYQNSYQAHVEKMLVEGVDMIDVGGMSSRPGAEIISEEEEWERIEAALFWIKNNGKECLLSIDTIHASVAEKSAKMGVHIINDISAGTYEENIFEVAAKYKLPFVLMHKKGIPKDMQTKIEYEDILSEMYQFLFQQKKIALRYGVNDCIIDMGFGFGKTLPQNYFLLQNIDYFKNLESPILIGISRKSMIYRLLDSTPEDSLAATSALHMYILQQGAQIYRVHDVKEMRDCIKLYETLQL